MIGQPTSEFTISKAQENINQPTLGTEITNGIQETLSTGGTLLVGRALRDLSLGGGVMSSPDAMGVLSAVSGVAMSISWFMAAKAFFARRSIIKELSLLKNDELLKFFSWVMDIEAKLEEKTEKFSLEETELYRRIKAADFGAKSDPSVATFGNLAGLSGLSGSILLALSGIQTIAQAITPIALAAAPWLFGAANCFGAVIDVVFAVRGAIEIHEKSKKTAREGGYNNREECRADIAKKVLLPLATTALKIFCAVAIVGVLFFHAVPVLLAVATVITFGLAFKAIYDNGHKICNGFIALLRGIKKLFTSKPENAETAAEPKKTIELVKSVIQGRAINDQPSRQKLEGMDLKSSAAQVMRSSIIKAGFFAKSAQQPAVTKVPADAFQAGNFYRFGMSHI
ncbi:MAG: hypothetical protein A2X78_05155 [Gammaproteobacteria bacterium GWE2_37_16]|nr:MAG: hypothetical protein A2X78_05155 [Gammaproteobacteria bacterium GWE2_37_16]